MPIISRRNLGDTAVALRRYVEHDKEGHARRLAPLTTVQVVDAGSVARRGR
jgi:hypothetical protein